MTALEMSDQVLSSFPVLDTGDDRPAHTRIEEWLERLIHSGQLKLEDRLPSEVEMAGALGVSRMTLRQALNGLESKGLLVRKRGRWGGSFVARPRLEYELSGLPGFTEQMRRSNALAGARVTEAATVRPAPEVRQALQLARGHKVHRIVRVRSANREPVAVEVNSYPAELFPGLLAESLTGSLYALLRKSGHAPFSATEVLEPVIASPEYANLLWMEEGSPLMLVQRTAYNKEGRPVEHSFDYFRPDRIRITLRTQADAAPRAEVETATVRAEHS
ncbi:MAG TPA: GntR family transcriptional regulator [Trebonia sp.]|nr:GntR family transcriptional regulator [Trebonia sp.]